MTNVPRPTDRRSFPRHTWPPISTLGLWHKPTFIPWFVGASSLMGRSVHQIKKCGLTTDAARWRGSDCWIFVFIFPLWHFIYSCVCSLSSFVSHSCLPRMTMQLQKLGVKHQLINKIIFCLWDSFSRFPNVDFLVASDINGQDNLCVRKEFLSFLIRLSS